MEGAKLSPQHFNNESTLKSPSLKNRQIMFRKRHGQGASIPQHFNTKAYFKGISK
jgi:hypothetical protein